VTVFSPANTKLKNQVSVFDAIYSQEVLYTLPNLHAHATLAFNILKDKGFYFATMGCYRENPFWAQRKEIIRTQESYPVCDYSLEEVVRAFEGVGFEVGLKKLPMEYFVIHGAKSAREFGGVLNLLTHCHEHKLLFCFYKQSTHV
ncbi:class I SAM-dependent methyltransferase, partial [Helicobacter salomonis]|uniref:hypothetical protein n=1 Tax=Helicobacter salomonis TaxID=56878 RepID=UPI0018F814AE